MFARQHHGTIRNRWVGVVIVDKWWWRRSVGDGEYVPFAGNTLGDVVAPVGELDARAQHEVAHRSRDEHFVRAGHAADSCADVHGKAGNVIAAPLTLTGMQPGTNVDAELRYLGDDSARAMHRPWGRSNMARNPSPKCLISRP